MVKPSARVCKRQKYCLTIFVKIISIHISVKSKGCREPFSMHFLKGTPERPVIILNFCLKAKNHYNVLLVTKYVFEVTTRTPKNRMGLCPLLSLCFATNQYKGLYFKDSNLL